jgi:hypothetical protein
MNDARNPDDESHKPIDPTLIGDRVPEQVGAAIGPYKLMEQIGKGGFGLVLGRRATTARQTQGRDQSH